MVDNANVKSNSLIYEECRKICIEKCGFGIERNGGKIECTNSWYCRYDMIPQPNDLDI